MHPSSPAAIGPRPRQPARAAVALVFGPLFFARATPFVATPAAISFVCVTGLGRHRARTRAAEAARA